MGPADCPGAAGGAASVSGSPPPVPGTCGTCGDTCAEGLDDTEGTWGSCCPSEASARPMTVPSARAGAGAGGGKALPNSAARFFGVSGGGSWARRITGLTWVTASDPGAGAPACPARAAAAAAGLASFSV
ncbi:hypothetical protein VR44_37220, partial [Streptomyces katrae]